MNTDIINIITTIITSLFGFVKQFLAKKDPYLNIIKNYRQDIATRRKEIEDYAKEQLLGQEEFIEITPDRIENLRNIDSNTAEDCKAAWKDVQKDIKEVIKKHYEETNPSKNKLTYFISKLIQTLLIHIYHLIHIFIYKHEDFSSLYIRYFKTHVKEKLFNGKLSRPILIKNETGKTCIDFDNHGHYYDYINSCELIAFDAWICWKLEKNNSSSEYINNTRNNIFNINNRVIAQGVNALTFMEYDSETQEIVLAERSDKVLEAPGTLATIPAGTIELNDSQLIRQTLNKERLKKMSEKLGIDIDIKNEAETGCTEELKEKIKKSITICITREFLEEISDIARLQDDSINYLNPLSTYLQEIRNKNINKFKINILGHIIDPLTLKIETCCTLHISSDYYFEQLKTNYESDKIIHIPIENIENYEQLLPDHKSLMYNSRYILHKVKRKMISRRVALAIDE